eukprot:4488340-Lingulodinium_polyedra.AAC.1
MNDLVAVRGSQVVMLNAPFFSACFADAKRSALRARGGDAARANGPLPEALARRLVAADRRRFQRLKAL